MWYGNRATLKCHEASVPTEMLSFFSLINVSWITVNLRLISRVLKKWTLIIFASFLLAFVEEVIFGSLKTYLLTSWSLTSLNMPF